MIAKFKNRVDFAGLVNYAHDIRSDKKRGRLLAHQGVCIVSNETIADSFNTHLRRPDSRGRVHHIGQPVKHVSISFSPEDAHLFPDSEQGDRFMAQLVNEWLRGMGITNAQYIVARHFDKTHPHCHLVFSRIDLDGNVISAFNEQLRSADICREIKLRHGLTFGNSSGKKVNRDRLLPIHQARFDIKTAVIAAAESSSSWAEFQRALEAEGIEANFSINHSTGKIRGIAFAKDGCRLTGSKLSKQKLTYSKLAAKFGALPVEGVAVLSIPFRSHPFNNEVAVGRGTTPSSEIAGVLENTSQNWLVTGKMASKTESPFEGDLHDSTPTEPSEVNLIPLFVILDLLIGPAVVQYSGGGGTTNDLDWNDERRRHQEAQENQYINRPFKRRR